MLFDDGGADRTKHRRHVVAAMLAGDLVDDHQLLVAVDFDRERGAEVDCLVRLLRSPLDVLRIEVATADDDDVLRATGDEQLAVVERSQIAGPQERSAAVGQPTAERLPQFFGMIPVSLGDRSAADPNLADLRRRGRVQRFADRRRELPDRRAGGRS